MITVVPVRLKEAFNLDVNNLDCLHQGELQGRDGETEYLCVRGLVGVRAGMVAKDVRPWNTTSSCTLSVLFSVRRRVCVRERERVLVSQLCPTL